VYEYIYTYVYIPLEDVSPDQLEERKRTGQSALFMFVRDLCVYVGACESLFSICADLCGWLCVPTHVCVYARACQESALGLATG